METQWGGTYVWPEEESHMYVFHYASIYVPSCFPTQLLLSLDCSLKEQRWDQEGSQSPGQMDG